MTEFIELDATPAAFDEYFPGWRIVPPVGPVSSRPDQETQIIMMVGDEIRSSQAIWGLVQHWRKHVDNPRHYVAGETIFRQWTLTEAFRNRRCIIPATSFSYLREVDGVTLRYRLRPAQGEILLLGGIHETRMPNFSSLSPTMALITTAPSRTLAPHGLPMPLLLMKKHVSPWLDPYADSADLRKFIQPSSRVHLSLEITVEQLPEVFDLVAQEAS